MKRCRFAEGVPPCKRLSGLTSPAGTPWIPSGASAPGLQKGGMPVDENLEH
ncbi:hypothetical protein H0O01_03460 [Candidatus Micrarchaeota archaeon]|nr:hypothetical protein [Candidatus Micrarchaeota archaeon]